jgi:hypothetical protein
LRSKAWKFDATKEKNQDKKKFVIWILKNTIN